MVRDDELSPASVHAKQAIEGENNRDRRDDQLLPPNSRDRCRRHGVARLIDVQGFTVLCATFLSVSGLLRGTAAAIAADEFWAGELNRWDEAAFLISLSVIIYWAGS